jgi:uncharacterized protein
MAMIALTECEKCGRRWQTAFAGCPYCGSTATHREEFAGVGSVYSWVEVCRSLDDPPADVPYTVITVDLDAGARVFGRYAPGGAPAPGERVMAALGSWSDADDGEDTRSFEPA